MNGFFQTAARISLVVAFALAITACGEPTGDAPANTEPEFHVYGYDRALDEKIGQTVFEETCATCHDGGDARAPHTAMLRLMSAESIFKAMTEGAMQSQAEGLSEDEKTRVAEHLADHRIGDRAATPEPLMCTGQAATFDVNEPPAWPGPRGRRHPAN